MLLISIIYSSIISITIFVFYFFAGSPTNAVDLADSAIRAIESGVTAGPNVNKSTLIIHSVQRVSYKDFICLDFWIVFLYNNINI